jgi:hypothetical protein
VRPAPALALLPLLAALALAQCHAVDVPVKVEGGHCIVGYLPPGSSSYVKRGDVWPREGGTVHIWADRPVEACVRKSARCARRYFGEALAFEAGEGDTVVVRNPHGAGVVYSACVAALRAPAGLAAYGAGMTAPPVVSGLEAREVRGQSLSGALTRTARARGSAASPCS